MAPPEGGRQEGGSGRAPVGSDPMGAGKKGPEGGRDFRRVSPLPGLAAAMDPEFDEAVSSEDLLALERRFVQEQRGGGAVSRRTRFEYAWGLVRSRYATDIARGIELLGELFPGGSREEQRDYIFYLALGNYRLREYERALTHVERLLGAEPHNQQGLRLRGLIRHRMQREGLLGAAIVGGVALGVAGLAGLLGLAISRARK